MEFFGFLLVLFLIYLVASPFISAHRINALRDEMQSMQREVDSLKKHVKALQRGQTAPLQPLPQQSVDVERSKPLVVHEPLDLLPPVTLSPRPQVSVASPKTVVTEAPPYEKPKESPLRPLIEVWPLLVRFVRGGNSWVTAGVGILLTGLGFFAQYVAQREHLMRLFPVELRLALVALCGIALTSFGWKLRERKATYALVLQGGGVGVLYLTVFATLKLTTLLPTALAFLLLAAVVALSALLAVMQNSQAFACLAALGGFAAPLLVSTGSGNYIALFSFYTLLNGGILWALYRKLWKGLPLIGAVATFGIMGIWVTQSYTPADYLPAQIFLLLFFLAYSAVSLLALRFHTEQDAPLVSTDYAIAFGTPVAFALLQSAISQHFTYGLAVSSLLLGTYYIGMAQLLWKKFGESARKQAEIPLVVGVVLSNLSIPLALSGSATSAVWAVEGMLFVLLGSRYRYPKAIFFGATLQLLGGIFLLTDTRPALSPLLNHHFIGGMLVAFSALIPLLEASYQQREELLLPDSSLKGVFLLLHFWGCAWWYGTLIAELLHFAPDRQLNTLLLLAASLSSAFFYTLATRFRCSLLKWNLFAPIVCAAALLLRNTQLLGLYFGGIEALPLYLSLGAFFGLGIPISGLGFFSWGLFFASVYGLFFLERKTFGDKAPLTAYLVGFVFWIALWLREIAIRIPQTHWDSAILLVLCASALLCFWGAERLESPRLRYLVFIPLFAVASKGALLASLAISSGDVTERLLQTHPLRGWGSVAWAVFFTTHYTLLLKMNADFNRKALAAAHRMGFFSAVVLLQLEVHYWVHRLPIGEQISLWWSSLAILLVLPLLVYLLFTQWHRFSEAMQEWKSVYLLEGCGALCAFLMLWFVLTLFRQGSAAPFPYIPLLNPLDLALALCLGTSLLWISAARSPQHALSFHFPVDRLYWLLGSALFFWSTASLLRVFYHYSELASYAIVGSRFFNDGLLPLKQLGRLAGAQTGITLLWGLWGSGLMFYGGRKAFLRSIWLTGSVILTITTLKIFLVDLARTNTLTRVASFMVTGLLLIAIGYFAPLPPKNGADRSQD